MLDTVRERLTSSPAFQVVRRLMKRYRDDGGSYLASAISYHAFLSLFPLLLLGLSVIGFFLSDAAARADWVGRLTDALPGLSHLVGPSIETVVRTRAGSGIGGLLGIIWTGSAVLGASRFTLRKILRTGPPASFVRRKARTVGTLLLIAPLALIGVLATGAIAQFALTGAPTVIGRLLGWLLGGVVAFGLFLVTYRMLSRLRAATWGRLWPGALVAAVGWLLLQAVGALYVAGVVARASAVYGSFAVVVGILVLLQLAARVFVYGAELNAVLMERRGDL